MSDNSYKIMPGMVLLEDRGDSAQLWGVSGTRAPRKDGKVTATLRAFEGRGNGPGDVYASIEATARFPNGFVRSPFRLVSALDVVRGVWPERLKSWTEDEVMTVMAAFDQAQPDHRPWESIVSDLREGADESDQG